MNRVIEALKAVFSPERLEDLPARHIDPFRRDLLGWIFGREALPREPVAPRRRGPGFLSWLLRPEDLPEPESGRAPAGRSFLGMLFAREELPREAKPAGAGKRGGGPPR